MGALGNGRRGGRSPPLLLGALIACILLLGFNYWVTSSRNEELQVKVLELETRARRVVAEKEAAEQAVQERQSEVEAQIQRQNEQVARMESSYKKQQESAQEAWEEEKAKLQLNISSSAKAVQDMKNELKTLLEDLGKAQRELQSCQGNLESMTKKFTFDLTQCNTQILAQRESCAEKVATAKQEAEKKYQKLPPSVPNQSQKDTLTQNAVSPKEAEPRKVAQNESVKVQTEVQNTEPEPKADNKTSTDIELETNKIVEGKAEAEAPEPVKDADGANPAAPPSSKPVTEKVKPVEVKIPSDQPSSRAEADAKTGEVDVKEKIRQDPMDDDMVIGEEKQEDYDADAQEMEEEEKDEQFIDKEKERAEQDLRQELADYNGDEENEPEFEADKQAQLSQM
ncbi:Golgi membrane protein 1 [Chanos chanos]|uniref:Golgi membrane protein 1 n=1 Tax=Chanos chanos TaxID=29144 RepID=A0A6J2W355_CHACN|nr:Golgi membrane protein 1 [Chanos chanos]